MYVATYTVLEITVGYWPFSDQIPTKIYFDPPKFPLMFNGTEV